MSIDSHKGLKTRSDPRNEKNESSVARQRVAIVCDMLEEQWHSMDLIADMLLEYLRADHAETIEAVRVRPCLSAHFSNLPFVGGKRAARNADRLLNRMWYYPRRVQRLRASYDVYHIIDHSYSQLIHALPPERTIITCHDLDTFECLLEPENHPRPRWFRAMTRRILDGLQKAALVTCDSLATRDEILHYDLLPPERLKLVYLGAHPTCTVEPNEQADAKIADLIGATNERQINLLHVGSTIPRKRIDVLLRVFAEVSNDFPTARLVRVGGEFTAEQEALLDELKLRNRVRLLPFLTREELAAIYRRATLVLQTSEREGFGLPIIEAMACGAIVVASDLSVLREIGGAAATYCPVADISMWRDTIGALLHERERDSAAWEQRRARGLRQAAKFSWANCTQQMVALYRQLATS